MKKRSASFLLLLLMFVVVFAAGCQKKENMKPVVLVLLKTLDNPFFIDMGKGFSDNWKQSNIAVHTRAGSKEDDVTAQRQIMESFYQNYVKNRETPLLYGVVLTPASSGDELVPQIKQFRESNIPVIILDTRIDEKALERGVTNYNYFIGSSNRAGGALAGQLIYKYIPNGGNLLLLNGVQGQETANERREGFLDEIRKLSKQQAIKYVIEERTANWRRTEAQSTVESFLTLGKQFDGVFAANDQMALGAADAFKTKGQKHMPIIIGFDAVDDAKKAVDAGILTATIAQRPYEMGKKAAVLLPDVAKTQPINQNIMIDVEPVMKVSK